MQHHYRSFLIKLDEPREISDRVKEPACHLVELRQCLSLKFQNNSAGVSVECGGLKPLCSDGVAFS
jgi:hypothetical protein